MSGSAISFTRGEDPLRADKLNAAFAERVLRSGDTMTGYLTLVGDPIDPFHAATKQYIDSAVITAVGGAYLPLTGGTLTGPLTVGGTLALPGGVLAATNTGNFDIKTGATTSLVRLLNNNSASLLLVGGTSAPVNRLSLTASNASGNIGIAANGSDTDISMNLAAKGAGFLNAQSRIQAPRLNLQSGTTTWTGSGAPSATTSGFFSQQTHTGTGTTGGGPRLNYLSIGSESIDADPQAVQAFRLTHQVDTGATGQRQTFFVQGVQIGATAATFGPLVAFGSSAEMRFNSGGVAGNRKAGAFGFNPYTIISSGASYLLTGCGGEINVSVRDPTGVQRKTILQLVSDSADLYPGVSQDTGLTIASQNNAIGAKDAIGIGYWGSQFPVAASGETSILRAYRQLLPSGTRGQTVQRGIDLLEADVTRWAFRTSGFQVHGSSFNSGAVQIGQGVVQTIANALNIDVPGNVGTGTPVVSAGGSGYAVGDLIYDAYGGVYSVATISGSAIATVGTPIRQPMIPGAAPANPVATTASSTTTDPGSGATLTLSWTAATTMNLGTGSATMINIGRTGATTTIAGLVNAVNDAAAAAAGIAVTGIYRNGSALMVRVA